jgi:hypothetical protein
LEQPVLTNSRRIRWIADLMEYDMTIVYAPGKLNPSDALSRLQVLGMTEEGGFEVLKELSVCTPELSPLLRERIIAGYRKDPFYRSSANRAVFELADDLLFFKDRICIPNDAGLKSTILRELHDAPYSGHQGQKRTLDKVARAYFWPRMAHDVREYIRACLECQRNKVRTVRARGLLNPCPHRDAGGRIL